MQRLLAEMSTLRRKIAILAKNSFVSLFVAAGAVTRRAYAWVQRVSVEMEPVTRGRIALIVSAIAERVHPRHLLRHAEMGIAISAKIAHAMIAPLVRHPLQRVHLTVAALRTFALSLPVQMGVAVRALGRCHFRKCRRVVIVI